MTNKISLTASMRSNLSSLQNISRQVSDTQNRLSTGKKVNAAIDNPSSYYTARSLDNRANDLSALLDSMGQAVQTIKAANEGIESAAGLLEQMRAVTEQTLSEAQMVPHQVEIEFNKDTAALIAEGYTAITADMTKTEIQNILNSDNAKVVFTEDVSFTGNLEFRGKNVVINGGGHKITMQSGYISNWGSDVTFENMQIENNYGKNGWYTRGIYSGGANTTVRNVEITLNDVKSAGHGVELHGGGVVENVNFKLNGNAKQLIGAYVWGSSNISNANIAFSGGENTLMAAIASQSDKVTVDKIGMEVKSGKRAYGILGTVKGFEGHAVGSSVDTSSSLFTGKANTDAIVAEIGKEGLAAYATSQFYIGDKNGEFGQGKWYLPSIGELMNVYGFDNDKIIGGVWSISGAVGDNKKTINAALSALSGFKDAEGESIASTLKNGWYWSSSECYSGSSWGLDINGGYRGYYDKSYSGSVRSFQLVENLNNTIGRKAQIGDVMYDDKTYGSADDYAAAAAAGKTAVGVVTEVLNNGSVKIMNLKDLTFGSATDANNSFNPEDPYGGAVSTTRWSTGSSIYKDISGIENYADWEWVLAMNPSFQVVDVQTLNSAYAQLEAGTYQDQYNEILNQYDSIINDSTYKGINLLHNDALNVRFNEDGSSSATVLGKDMSSAGVGLKLADWAEKEGILQSVKELSAAVSTLRSFSAELGSNYNIVTTRQDFTENLINVLTEGADKLTLADMNEESANMLALQTRQQLAVNALSLANQASQGVLKLF